MKINQLATAFVGRKMTASRGLLGHTLDTNKCHHGSPAQKLLFLSQSSVKILNWKHKTVLISGYRARTAVTALQPCLKHPYSSEKHPILGTWGWGAISPWTLCAWPHSYFRPREQTEAMGMSTAVKEIKQLSAVDADSSTLMTFLPAAGVTTEEQGCPKGPGTPSSCCGGAMGSVPKDQGE